MATDYTLKNGQGYAFTKQKTKETQPDFQGEIMTPKGEKYEISIWKKPTRNGGEFLSFSIKEPYCNMVQGDLPPDTPIKNELPWEHKK